jgi:hypothetical protein
MIFPPIMTGVEETVSLPAHDSRKLLPLGTVAEGTAPSEVVQMVRAISLVHRYRRMELSGEVRCPASRGDNMVELKQSGSGQQAIFARIARPEACDQANGCIVRIVLGSESQLP